MDTPELTPEIYAQLRSLARRIHGDGRRHQTVQPTVLLHEAWAKVSQSSSQFNSRKHFIAVTARAMRQILVDHVRAKGREKRGGNVHHTTISGVVGQVSDTVDLLALDEALTGLEAVDPDAARIVQLRVFGGLTVDEVADVIGSSPRSVHRTWKFARAWLSKQLE